MSISSTFRNIHPPLRFSAGAKQIIEAKGGYYFEYDSLSKKPPRIEIKKPLENKKFDCNEAIYTVTYDDKLSSTRVAVQHKNTYYEFVNGNRVPLSDSDLINFIIENRNTVGLHTQEGPPEITTYAEFAAHFPKAAVIKSPTWPEDNRTPSSFAAKDQENRPNKPRIGVGRTATAYGTDELIGMTQIAAGNHSGGRFSHRPHSFSTNSQVFQVRTDLLRGGNISSSGKVQTFNIVSPNAEYKGSNADGYAHEVQTRPNGETWITTLKVTTPEGETHTFRNGRNTDPESPYKDYGDFLQGHSAALRIRAKDWETYTF